MPVVYTGDAGRSVGPVEADTFRGGCGPTSYVDLTAGTIGEGEGCGAKDIGLDVHGSPGCGEVVELGEIKFIGSCAAGVCGGAELFDESDFAVSCWGDDERDHDAADQELVGACCVAGGDVPAVEWLALPLVVR